MTPKSTEDHASAEPSAPTTLRVALAGNPNAGKTSLFNKLTGARARVGNYPGVTVEKRVGAATVNGRVWQIQDIPGCYSLDADSEDERVALRALTDASPEGPHVAVVVLDAGQLGRNLLLLLEIQALGLPVVAAVNLVAEARTRGISVDYGALSAALGCPVVPIEAPSGEGIEALLTAAEATAMTVARPQTSDRKATDDPGSEKTIARFARIDSIVADCVREEPEETASWTDRVDRFVLHPVAGGLLFVAVLGLLFQGVFAWSDPAIDAVDALGGAVAGWATGVLTEGYFRSVLIDGAWAGVVGTAVFLPQICVLFLGIEVLEDSGYLARAVVLADRLMRAAGLPGRAFVPLLSSFACNVPGIMAARTIPSRSQRLATIMVAPLMACSARLPVYTMVTAAVLAGNEPVLGFLSLGGLVITGMYLFGLVLALIAALLLRKTALKGPGRPVLIELPVYRWPRVRNVVSRVWHKARRFTIDTGSVIVALTVVLWALMTFPQTELSPVERAAVRSTAASSTAASSTAASSTAASSLDQKLERATQRKRLEQSYAGKLGKLIEPAIAPLGFDWRIGIGLIGSFAAREVLIPVMAQVYGRGADDSDEASAAVGKSLVRISGMTPLVGISLMVFFAIAMQCLSTVAVIKTETGGWKWPIFAVVYLNVLAWLASAAVFQIGTALGYS